MSTVFGGSSPSSSADFTSCASCGLLETMAMFCTPSIFFPLNCPSSASPAIPIGTSSVVIRNSRLRTRSRYSRFAISSVLRSSPLCIGAPSHRLDKNLLQRRFHQLEFRNRRPCRRRSQQILRVRVRLQLDLRVPRIVLVFRNRRMLQKSIRALILHDHSIALVARLHLAHPARQHRSSPVDQAN